MSYTFSDLKARIAEEIDRDDLVAGGPLETRLAQSIARAIEYYADEPFWFRRGDGEAVTSAGAREVSLPASVRIAHDVSLAARSLRKIPFESMVGRSGPGRPSHWAETGDAIALWPIPDGSYTLSISGIAAAPAPEADGDISVWTNEAFDLIAARARFLLFRDVLRDTEGTQLAAQAEGEALSKLRREGHRRGRTALGAAGDEPWSTKAGFSIDRGQ
jgi:hypothetical protein